MLEMNRLVEDGFRLPEHANNITFGYSGARMARGRVYGTNNCEPFPYAKGSSECKGCDDEHHGQPDPKPELDARRCLPRSTTHHGLHVSAARRGRAQYTACTNPSCPMNTTMA